jgi:hypothetical protein
MKVKRLVELDFDSKDVEALKAVINMMEELGKNINKEEASLLWEKFGSEGDEWTSFLYTLKSLHYFAENNKNK